MHHTLNPRLNQHALGLLTRLRDQGITLYLDEGKLKTKARKNAVTPELATDIKASKAGLIEVLSAIQPESVNAEQVEQQLAFWREYLHNAPPQHNLPGHDVSEPDVSESEVSEQGTFARYVFDCNVLDADFPDPEYDQSNEHPDHLAVFAAFVAWLSLFTRSSDVMVAHETDGVWRSDMGSAHEFFRPALPLRFYAPFHETEGLNPNKNQEPEQSVSQWLQHYQHSIEQGRENGVVAYDCLSQLLQTGTFQAALNQNKLCQIALVKVNASDPDEADIDEIKWHNATKKWQARGFELVVGYLPSLKPRSGAAPKLLWWADSSRFSSQQIHGFSESFTEFLQAFVAPENASKPVTALPLISKRDKARVLASCKAQQATNAPASLQDPRSLVSAFEAQVKAHPNRIALKFALDLDKEELTYSQLNAKANQLAHALLQALPVTQSNSDEPTSQLVGLCVSRSLESVIGILGILKAGLGYLPLDPDYPASRLQHMVQDSGIALVVRDSSADFSSDASVFDSITSLDINQVNAGESHSHSANSYSANPNTHNPNLPIQPGDLAYVIYTSGSTGKPKGVAVEHGNVLRLFSTASAHFQFTEQDVWSIFHSFSFDFSVWEMWGALLHGGCGVIVPRIVAQDPAAFYRLATESGVTVLNQTPSAFESFSLVDEAQTGKNSSLSNALRYVIFGGEALKFASLQGWVNRHGDAQPELVNMYGITETTVHVTYKRLLREDVFAGTSARSKKAHSKSAGAGSLIGAPLGDLSAYVLDSRGALLPPGAVGELYVGGAGVSRGYWNCPELTAQKFVSLSLADSFYGGSSYTSTLDENTLDENDSHDHATQRLYKTGDLARLQLVEEAGNTRCELIYMGRIDQQVQLRGFRIELGEIDHLLLQQADISQALTVMLSSSDTDREQETQRDSNTYIVSYVVQAQIQQKAPDTNPENTSLSSRLREALAAQLPDYMVPSAFVRLDALPMTAHGKIDRARLPAPDFSAGASDYQAPETEQEQAIARVWQQVLNVPRVGLNDDFFALGGDSMKALTLVAQCRSAGLAVGIQDLYAAPQLSKLLLRDNASTANRAEIAPFALVSEHDKTALLEKFGGDAMANAIADIYPMTELQQGMLARNLLAQDLGIYHDILGYHLHTPWHAEHFAEALQQVIARNEVLRTLFCLDSEFAHQIVLQQYQGDIHVQDLRHLSAQEQEDAIQSWITEEKVQAFDFAKPTWNIHIHIRSDEAFQYSLNFNHALLDGWSVANLNAQLFNHYMDLQEASVPVLEKEKQAATPALPYRYHVHFEREALADASLQTYWQDLLADAQLPWWTGPLKQGVSREVLEIKGSDAQKLVQLAKRYKVSEKTVLQATYLVLMSLLSGKKDVVTSVVVNSRSDEAGSDQTLGLFLNSLPFRLNLTHLTWPALIRQCEQTAQRIQASKHYPLTAIQRDMGLDFSASIFNYVELHLYNELQQRIRVSSGKVFDDKDYLLSFEIFKYIEAQSDNQSRPVFELRLDVDPAIFPQEFHQRIVTYYRAILASLVSESPAILSNQDFIPQAELARQAAWNHTQMALPKVQGIHQLVEQQAMRTPNNIAAVFADEYASRITYQDLNRKANQLAHKLMELGVQTEEPVGLCMRRSLDMVVSILAIVKAGGAWVPLEPTLPKERLDYMVENAGIDLVIGHRAVVGCLSQANWLCLDSQHSELSAYLDTNPNIPALQPENLAYIFYTSGSTGKPKGVMCKHLGLINRIVWGQEKYQFTEQDAFLQKTPFMFDISICEFFAPLCCGARIVLPEPEGHKDPQLLYQVIREHKVTIAHFVPTMMNAFLASVDISQCASLRLVVNGGEEMSKELSDKFFASGTDCAYHNLYGPTEAAIESSFWHCDATSELDFVPIGKPIANTQLLILDDQMQPVPIGVEGELHIGGAGLARGYKNLPEQTNEKFVAYTPAGSQDANQAPQRLYKTGDLARFMPCGNIQYLGRLDDQVKINGLRIELGEIKSALLQLHGIGEALVVADRSATRPRINAYVVANADGLIQEQTQEQNQSQKQNQKQALAQWVRNALQDTLPLYMIPSVVMVLERFPLLTNGKINKHALPPIQDSLTVAFEAPVTDTETVLAEICQHLLDINEPVGVAASFFELGGQSLLAIRLINEIRERFGVSISFAALFNQLSLRQLAGQIDAEVAKRAVQVSHDDELADNETEILI